MPLLLDAITKKLQVLTDATATTTELPIVSMYVDISSSATASAPAETDTITNGTTAVDAVAAPGASTQRAVKGMVIYNADTVQHLVTVRYNNNGTLRILCKVLLAVGQTLVYNERGDWVIVPCYLSVDPGICEGRLTLTTAVPVTTSDVTGATTVYFTPYKGNRISLYTNSAWTLYTFAERSIALGTLASATIPNDIFIYDNSGTLTLELVAWTSTTARATAIVLQDGVYVKSGSTNKRYLGTFAPTATTTTEDSVLNRLLWNYYNQIPRKMLVTDNTSSWTQTSTTYVQRGSKQVNFVVGVQEALVRGTLQVAAINGTSGASATVTIGLDSATSAADCIVGVASPTAGTGAIPILAQYRSYVAIGKHSLVWAEAVSSGTATFFGSSLNIVNPGIEGELDA